MSFFTALHDPNIFQFWKFWTKSLDLKGTIPSISSFQLCFCQTLACFDTGTNGRAEGEFCANHMAQLKRTLPLAALTTRTNGSCTGDIICQCKTRRDFMKQVTCSLPLFRLARSDGCTETYLIGLQAPQQHVLKKIQGRKPLLPTSKCADCCTASEDIRFRAMCDHRVQLRQGYLPFATVFTSTDCGTAAFSQHERKIKQQRQGLCLVWRASL